MVYATQAVVDAVYEHLQPTSHRVPQSTVMAGSGVAQAWPQGGEQRALVTRLLHMASTNKTRSWRAISSTCVVFMWSAMGTIATPTWRAQDK